MASKQSALLLFLVAQLLMLSEVRASRELLLNAPSPGDSLLLMQPSREWGSRGDLSRAERQKHNTRARHLRAQLSHGGIPQAEPYAHGGSGPGGKLTIEERKERLQWQISAGLRVHLDEPTNQREGQGDGSDARRADFKKGSSENRIVTKGQRKQLLEASKRNSSTSALPIDSLFASIASGEKSSGPSSLSSAASVASSPPSQEQFDAAPAADTKRPSTSDTDPLPLADRHPSPLRADEVPPDADIRAPIPFSGDGRPSGRSARRYSKNNAPLAQKALVSAAQSVAMAAAEAAAASEQQQHEGAAGVAVADTEADVDYLRGPGLRVAAVVRPGPDSAAKHSALAQAAAAAEAAEGGHAHFLSEAARAQAEAQSESSNGLNKKS